MAAGAALTFVPLIIVGLLARKIFSSIIRLFVEFGR
jgi:hypothetical protein